MSRSTPNTGPEARRSAAATEGASIERVAARLEALISRAEQLLPRAPVPPNWDESVAFRWRRRGPVGELRPVSHLAPMRLSYLKNIDPQKKIIEQNTRQFVLGRPANNVLLTGARGTGKSSLIKACLSQFSKKGLRLIEVDKADLVDLPDIVELIADRPERFIIFCDDLSFEQGDGSYKALKVALDGSLNATSENVLIYATSNRRHLMPEQQSENASYVHQDDGEIHPGEVIEEKISLSERFGLWVSFYPFRQEEYLAAVAQWLEFFGARADVDRAREDALRWALERGSRSGRVAWQFARDWAGKNQTKTG